MKMLILLVTLLSSTTWAGDGGFDLWTCSSTSGRTSLTVFADHYSGANITSRVVFAIDGQFLTYEDSSEECTTDDCTEITFKDGKVAVTSGDFANITISLKDTKATVLKGYAEPRPNYPGVGTEDIALSCKRHHEEP